MRSVSKFTLAMTAFIAAAATAVAVVGPAAADPPTGVVPKVTDIVSVGSSTTQALNNALSAAWNSQSPAPAARYYSWDATGSPTIQSKAGQTIKRPTNSAEAIAALNASTNVLDPKTGRRTQVDSVRSNFGPTPGNSSDVVIPDGQDAVGWAGFTGTSTQATDSPSTLSYTDLQQIYGCSITNWAEIKDIPGYVGPDAPIKVFLPPAGSDTRILWLGDLNITGTALPCWQTTTPAENEGTDQAFADPAAISPYSLGHYVGQAFFGRSSGTDAPGFLDANRSILNPSGVTGTVAQIVPSARAINTTLTFTVFFHWIYCWAILADFNVISSPEGIALRAALNPVNANPPGWLCTNTNSSVTQGNILTGYGFLPMSKETCGVPQQQKG